MGYFTQILKVDGSNKDKSRHDFIKELVKNKKVLHIGFVDYPITKPKKSLHLYIANECIRLDGIDPNINEETKKILNVPNGNIYTDWSQLPNDYDIILVPEVIEHVDNVAIFLQQLDRLNGMMVVTAPCAYTLKNNFREENEFFTETVHPDHNCWYSPYTLKNVIDKYSKRRQVESLHWTLTSIIAICKEK